MECSVLTSLARTTVLRVASCCSYVVQIFSAEGDLKEILYDILLVGHEA